MGAFRRWLNRAGGAFLALVLAVVLVVAAYRAFFLPMFPEDIIIAHAGGAIDGITYTNSIAALDGSVAAGFTYVEVDFQKTSDGVIVCGHDWDYLPAGAPVYAEFVASRGSRSACLLDEFLDWMDAHPEVILISDAKEDVLEINAMLRERLGHRLVPQAYDAAQAMRLLTAGNSSVILTLYRLDGFSSELREIEGVAGLGDRLHAVTMPGHRALAGLGLWAKFRTGRPVLAHTINDCEIAGVLQLMGVDGFYTDVMPAKGC